MNLRSATTSITIRPLQICSLPLHSSIFATPLLKTGPLLLFPYQFSKAIVTSLRFSTSQPPHVFKSRHPPVKSVTVSSYLEGCRMLRGKGSESCDNINGTSNHRPSHPQSRPLQIWHRSNHRQHCHLHICRDQHDVFNCKWLLRGGCLWSGRKFPMVVICRESLINANNLIR